MDNGLYSKTKSWIADQAWVAIVVTFLTIVLGILLSEIQTKLGWLILIISLITILTIFFVIIWLIVRPILSVSVELADKIHDTIDKYIGSEKIGWILTTPQLVKFEKNSKFPEIWLISSDLSEDSMGGPFQSVVAANLEKGIRYRYFVPNRAEIYSRVEQLTKYHSCSGNINFTYLNDDFFFLVPKFDFAIYNPFNEKQLERIAYMGIPVDEKGGHYHAKVSSELIDVLIGKLMPLIK